VRENCATCHDPHGSPNERMLVQKQPFMCQRCHSHIRHPGTLYDGRVIASSNRIYARSCVTCHSMVHGSNHPSGHFFLR
jgi:predicted CXXCH cytochrome family protein